MRRFAVFTQALAVIAQGNDQGARGDPQLVEAPEQAADLLVHVGNFTVVETLRVLVLIRFGRVVGLVGIVVMRPEEELPLAILFQPIEGAIGDHAGAPLRENAREFPFLLFGAHVVVISIKPMGKAKVLRHHARAHKGSGGKACGLHKRSEGGMRFAEDKAAHVAQLVNHGVGAGHDAGVRRQGEGNLRGGVGESNPTRGQRIQVRRLGAARAVATQVVGARGVESDQQDACVARSRCGGILSFIAVAGRAEDDVQAQNTGGRPSHFLRKAPKKSRCRHYVS